MCWLERPPLLLPLLFFSLPPFCGVPFSTLSWSMVRLSGRGSVWSGLLWSLCHTDTHIYGNGGVGLRLWSVRLGIGFGDEWQLECVTQGEEERRRRRGVNRSGICGWTRVVPYGSQVMTKESEKVCLSAYFCHHFLSTPAFTQLNI